MKENNMKETVEFLTFKMGKELFALETSKVKEVLKYSHITQVPGMPEYMPGVINLRGNVVSLVDLCLIPGMNTAIDKAGYWLIITEYSQDSELLTIGMMVESVEDVIRIKTSSIGPPPEIGIKIHPDFIRAIGKKDGTYFIVLDTDKIVSVLDSELAKIDNS